MPRRWRYTARCKRMRLAPFALALVAGLSGCVTSEVTNNYTSATAESASGVTLDTVGIDAALAGMVADGRTVGASALVWKDGREVYFHAAGQADREAARPFARDTLVQIFSMTKPVTGVALMTLWEDGKFGLDDPLGDYLPEYAALQVYDGMDASGNPVLRAPKRPVTVRDIMRHTAGFTYGGGSRYPDQVWEQLEPLSADNTLAGFSQKMAQVPLVNDPGTAWEYSAGVDVQARLVEVLSGQPFADYVAAEIFAPLGMADTGWKRDAADLPRLAMIYNLAADGGLEPVPRGDWLEVNFAGKPMTMGGSGIVTTVDDYMLFARMLLGEGALDGKRILKPETIRIMATDHLDPRMTERAWLPGKGQMGFGLDFAVRVAPPASPDEMRGTVGEFFWDGYPSMLFWVDPANDMAVVFATQRIPFNATLHKDIRAAVYGE